MSKWPRGLRKTIIAIVTTLLICAGLAAAIGSWFTYHNTSAVADEHTIMRQTAARNEFWLMLAGMKQPTDSVPGHLAATLRPLLHTSDPAHSLLMFYATPGKYPNINSKLGTKVIAYEKITSGRNQQTLDQGRLAPSFIVDAVQATPANVHYLVETVPRPESIGLLSWFNDAVFTLAWLALAAIIFVATWTIWMVVAYVHRRRLYAAAPPEIRDVLAYIKELRRMPEAGDKSSDVAKLLGEYLALRDYLTGEVPAQERAINVAVRLRGLSQDLKDIRVARRAGLEAARRTID